jgi:hypothetical protein
MLKIQIKIVYRSFYGSFAISSVYISSCYNNELKHDIDYIYTLENTEGGNQNGQSRETRNKLFQISVFMWDFVLLDTDVFI